MVEGNTNNGAKRAADALYKHSHGYNCAQSVACAFCDQTDLDEKTLFRFTEGMGLGMGCMEGTCGAIGAASILSGLKNSTVRLNHPDSKAASYKEAKACLTSFKDQTGSVICRELKGVDTGTVLCSCKDCIKHAVHIISREIYGEE